MQAARPAPLPRPPSQRGSLTGASEPSPLPEAGLSTRERTTGAEPGEALFRFAGSVRARGWARGGLRRLGVIGWRSGERHSGHSAARGAESRDCTPQTSSLACHLELCFKVASGRLLSAALSRRRSLSSRGVGWGEGTGSSVGARKAARPTCACALLARRRARGVRAGPRAPWRRRVL